MHTLHHVYIMLPNVVLSCMVWDMGGIKYLILTPSNMDQIICSIYSSTNNIVIIPLDSMIMVLHGVHDVHPLPPCR